MATDPFVARAPRDDSRQEANLAPGVSLAAATSWYADRAGDLTVAPPVGALFGRPGPNVGYALTLARRVSDGFKVAPHEPLDDALAVVGELAMKRAASFGRAPVVADVHVAAALLGYQNDVDPEFAAWRAHAVHGAHHDYVARRTVVDAVADDALRAPPQDPAALAELRAGIRAAVSLTAP
jgi:hypothetical protein